MTQYEYADGNGNVYAISGTSLVYRPVKPEESSTGMYSGGDPRVVSLKQEQYKAIRVTLEKAIANTSVHIPDRIKMSGLISVTREKETNRYILKPGSAEIGEIENALKITLK